MMTLGVSLLFVGLFAGLFAFVAFCRWVLSRAGMNA